MRSIDLPAHSRAAEHSGLPVTERQGALFELCRSSVNRPMDTGAFEIHAALPSAASARWLLPIGDRARHLQSTRIIGAYAPRARMAKALLRFLIRAGLGRWVGDRVILSHARLMDLRDLVRLTTGEASPSFAVSLGSAGAGQKSAVQVMNSSGTILCFLKLSASPDGIASLRHEASILRRLEESTILHSRVPRLLYAGDRDGQYVLAQTSGPSLQGPARMGEPHREFLRLLARVAPAVQEGRSLVERADEHWTAKAAGLPPEIVELGRHAIRECTRILHHEQVECGLVHGDFAPWNTRIQSDSLFVFDWETADWKSPIAYDRFHFCVQTAILLGGDWRQIEQATFGKPVQTALLLLYLLHSITKLAGEGVPPELPAIRKRCQRISAVLRNRIGVL